MSIEINAPELQFFIGLILQLAMIIIMIAWVT